MRNLKDFFLLSPEIIYLNHGSYGATPKPVFEVYQEWQRQLENQPVKFLGRELRDFDRVARKALAEYLNADSDDLVYVPNATHGVNIVARSLKLGPGDEVLTTDHEYGACNYAWEFICSKNGASYVHQLISLPVFDEDQIVEQFWRGVTPRTKLIFLSHITSSTALRFPIEKLCKRASHQGILTLIDGAHAPGQIPVDLHTIGADFYVGNCHKWMMAPKGAGFLYTRRDLQSLVEPLIVSWGYHADDLFTSGSAYVDYFRWSGTRDPAAALSVPAAIQFMQDHDWESVRQECYILLCQTLQRINNLTGLPSVYPDDQGFYQQMAIAELPPVKDAFKLKTRLYDDYQIEIPITEREGRQYLRISIQGYNVQEDIDALLTALGRLLVGTR